MTITVHLKPNAKENKIEWLDEDTLKAWVTAPPQKGKANKALIELLADRLNKSKSSIKIVRGTTIRIKQVNIG